MKPSTSFVAIFFRLSSRLLAYFDLPLTRIVLFLCITGFIASQTFTSPNNNWRTFEGLLLLGMGLGLTLRSEDTWSDWAGLILILFLILSPLYWRLQGYDTDGFTIGGVLPTSDAAEYFTGATRILYGENISSVAARRPLFATFLSVILFIFGQDLAAALVGMAVIVSIAIFLLVSEVRKNFGILPSSLTAVIMISCYTGRFAGKFLTEQLGIPLGILSLTLLLRGLRFENFRLATLGIFTLTLAQNTRPGALFVLPMLILWGATWTEKPGFAIKHFIVPAAVVGLGFILTYWAFTSVASPGSVPFGNFGSTLYGMATGYRGWRVWYSEYPGVSDTEAMRISIEIILKSPMVFLTAVLRAYRDFLNPQYFFSFLYLPRTQLTPAAYLLSGITVIGLWRLVQNRSTLFSRMMMFVLAGILLSIPFAPPPDDGIRAMTSTACFLALLAGCGLIPTHRFQRTVDESVEHPPREVGLLFFSWILIFITVAGWTIIRGSLKIPSQILSCNTGEYPVTVVITPKSYINVVKNNQRENSFIPDIRREELLDNLSNFPSSYLWSAFRRIKPGQTVVLGLNFADRINNLEPVWLVIQTSSIQQFNGVNYFCAKPTGNPELDNASFLIEREIENIFIIQ